jgi:hypothetical protein
MTCIRITMGSMPDAISLPCGCCPILELRRYTLHPGRRDDLIDLFDREFVESQEATGMRVVGQFRDVDAPDRFVWLRGFPDMEARARSLAAFYDGPVWALHRDAANATMVDSDDVLLLRPAGDGAGFVLPSDRPPAGAAAQPASLVVAAIYPLRAPAARGFFSFFEERMRRPLTETGARPLATLETEPAENTFPRLPVRTGEDVFVWFASFDTIDDHRRHVAALAEMRTWTDGVVPEMAPYLAAPPELLRLQPTARSLIGRPAP